MVWSDFFFNLTILETKEKFPQQKKFKQTCDHIFKMIWVKTPPKHEDLCLNLCSID